MKQYTEEERQPEEVATAFDQYTHHLTEVSKTREVIAEDNIYNEQGALLLKKGERLDASATDKIVRFKLLRPLEDSVAIKGEIDAELLYQHLNTALTQEHALYELHNEAISSAQLRAFCAAYARFPLLRQKVTVLSLKLPDYYQRSLLCVWLCLLLAQRLRMPEGDLSDLFIAALAHDIGMLHIDTEMLSRQNPLDPGIWRQIQGHPVIGRKILEGIPGMPEGIGRAVAEHHERCDGTGYPYGRFEGELSGTGQLIALVDTAVTIYLSRYKQEGRSLRDLIPFAQINAKAYFYRNYQALITLLRDGQFARTGIVPAADMPAFIERMLVHNQELKRWFGLLEQTLVPLGFTHEDNKLHAMQNVLLHLVTAINGSGVLDDGYQRWLSLVKTDKLEHAFREVEDAHLMLNEVEFHLRRLTRMMALYLSTDKANPEISLALQQGLAELKKVELSDSENGTQTRDVYAGPLFAITNPTQVVNI